jgi:hypothetical protein
VNILLTVDELPSFPAKVIGGFDRFTSAMLAVFDTAKA